ncbi:copper amine oxidase domain protein [Desulfofarcimen acetoxidans DSM 771]|uniref:Copper amine oxidase domain protein n=1 Tax=Desulfofarcimen acetoxidans (strain ATCC 49208 / DSM 771 / KCTC 5769 / VKM B-1644 / 5575) TaxID=485916 RepID=C8W611_DESAS|nr:copper amine oxidase N-terminal domain-containing protein [Desulfofarcimen acetoxidans]ACV61466.1 copper amine oxidase domain protein [Desulfofarcimen acetoxidans DSM 771]
MRYKVLILFAFYMLFSLSIGNQSAFASTVNKVLNVPTIKSATTTSLGTLMIKEEYPMTLKKGDILCVNLPSYIAMKQVHIDFFYDYDVTTVNSAVYSLSANDFKNMTCFSDNDNILSMQVENEQNFTLKINKIPENSTAKTFRFYIYFDSVTCKIKATDGDETKVILDGSGGFSSDTQTIAKVYAYGNGTTASAISSETLTDLGGETGTIVIKENGPGALEINTDTSDPDNCKEQKTVKLVLSAGVSWTSANIIATGGFTNSDIGYLIDVDSSGRSVLYLQINNKTTDATGSGRITLTGEVDVDSSIAQPGEIYAYYEGSNPGVSTATLTVATFKMPGCKVGNSTPTEVIAGHKDQAIGDIIIMQGLTGDLTSGRTVTFTLPEGVKWRSYPTNNAKMLDQATPVGSDGRTIKYTVPFPQPGSSSCILRNGSVDLAFDAPSQIEITVGGSVFSTEGKTIVANVITPIKLTASETDIFVGKQKQAVGDLIINETVAGTLRALDRNQSRAVLEIMLPPGVTFNKDNPPVVKVTDGDLVLFTDQVGLDSENQRTLLIPVSKSSSVSSTIEISNVILDVNRMVPEGSVKVEVGGTALTETDDLFNGSQNFLKAVIANCPTAAPQEIKTKAIFTIDSNSYEFNDKKYDMDVAPYIKNDRTYGPVRYIAYALGLNEQDVQWDASSQTVTLMHGGRVVQMKAGQPTMLVQGTEISIDAEPEIIEPGRLMLPYRWAASALNGNITWDADKKQVTVQNY